jgi:dipeptidyl aminopeptidase/acylaminoacyl peptidase
MRSLLAAASVFVIALAACRGGASAPASSTNVATPVLRPPRFAPRVATDVLPRALLFSEPERTAPRFSPDGKYLGFGATVNGVSGMWIAPADDITKAKPLHITTAGTVRTWRFANVSDVLIYSLETEGKEKPHVYTLDVRGDRAVDLTPEGCDAADLLHTSRKRPHEIAIGGKARGAEVIDLYIADIRTGTSRRVFTNRERFIDFDFDDDLVPRIGSRITETGEKEIRKLEPDGTSSILLNVGAQDQLTTSTLAIEGSTLYLEDSRGRDTVALVAFDMTTKQTSVIAADDRADIDGVLWNPRTGKPRAVASDPGKRTWRPLDDEIRADLAAISDERHSVDVISMTADDTKWILREHAPDATNSWSIYDRASRTKTPLFVDRPALTKVALNPMSVVDLRARDGLPLVGYLSMPSSRSSSDGPGPMVLFVHGGPWDRDRWELSSMHQLLSSRGYAVLSVNFRGSTGFGKKHLNAGNREWGGKMQDDLLDAVAWAIERKIADPTRIAIFGGSYGGYATLVGLSHNHGTFACGVDVAGPSNLVTFVDTIPATWRPFLGQFRVRIGDATTDAGHRDLLARSPLMQAATIDKPLLIVQGKNDPRVLERESAQMAEAVKKTGVPVTYLLYEDEGHGLADSANWISFSAVLEVFLSQCIGGTVEPFGTALHGSSIRAVMGGEHIAGLAKAAFEK